MVVVLLLQLIQYLSVVHLSMYLAMCSEDKSSGFERGIRGQVIKNKINKVEGSGCDILFVERRSYPDTENRLRWYIKGTS